MKFISTTQNEEKYSVERFLFEVAHFKLEDRKVLIRPFVAKDSANGQRWPDETEWMLKYIFAWLDPYANRTNSEGPYQSVVVLSGFSFYCNSNRNVLPDAGLGTTIYGHSHAEV